MPYSEQFKEKVRDILSLYIVKEFVSDVDIVSRNSFDHYLFAKKIIKFSQYIVLLNYISR